MFIFYDKTRIIEGYLVVAEEGENIGARKMKCTCIVERHHNILKMQKQLSNLDS